ncbi:MAG: hypothetical protein ACREE4_21700 [Stellaceae bacterium]
MARDGLGREIAAGVIGGLILFILIAIVGALWKWTTKEGLIQAIGGVTHEQVREQIAEEMAKHPAPKMESPN